MNVLVTGCNGFLGRELQRIFKENEYKFIFTNRQILDVLSENAVDNFFDINDIDVVVHTAVKGGRRDHKDLIRSFNDKLKMFGNLLRNRNKFKLMINFGSGAEFDRTLEISNACTDDLKDRTPQDFYGMSKKIITNEIVDLNENIINLRLFGCFGPLEENNRFIKTSLINMLKARNIIIHKDRYMDFFYVDDLATVIEHYIKNINNLPHLPKDLNLTYPEKYTLLEMGNYINSLTNDSVNVILQSEGLGLDYTGCSEKLSDLGLDLIGLDEGICRVLRYLQEQN